MDHSTCDATPQACRALGSHFMPLVRGLDLGRQNSALQDAIALAACLDRFRGEVAPALAAYSRERVPEGHALLDLSVGPSRNASAFRRLLFGLSAVVDSLLSKLNLSDPPLQTLLTTSLKPFAQIRRERQRLLGPFPSDADFARAIDLVDSSL